MTYRHNFGSYQETIRVDGEDYSCAVYITLPKAEREALRKAAVSRCVAANVRRSARFRELQAPIREAQRAAFDDLWCNPCFAKPYRGRAADIRREEATLRNEYKREKQAAFAELGALDGVDYPAAVEDVFYVWEEEVETDFERFERLVTHNDWYYGYSDDHRVYSAGERRGREIVDLLKQLQNDPEHAEAATLLHNQKCPWMNEDGSQNEE